MFNSENFNTLKSLEVENIPVAFTTEGEYFKQKIFL